MYDWIYLLDTAGILFHSDLFHGAFKAEEGLDVQTGRLLKACPVLIVRVDLYQRILYCYYYTVHICRSKMTTLLW